MKSYSAVWFRVSTYEFILPSMTHISTYEPRFRNINHMTLLRIMSYIHSCRLYIHASTYVTILHNISYMSTYGIILRNINHASIYEPKLSDVNHITIHETILLIINSYIEVWSHIGQYEPYVDIWNHTNKSLYTANTEKRNDKKVTAVFFHK